MAKHPHEFTAVDTMRHSTAHLLAAAVSELYPGTQFGVGPVIENGFYYDMRTARPLTAEDLPKLEEKMREIAARGAGFVRREMSIDEAIEFFGARGQTYKVELLTDLKQRGTTNLKEEELQDFDAAAPAVATIYETGEFMDLCRGPHVASTKEIGAFKLTTLAGAYWRGNQENDQLTRVYGVAFETQAELDAYLMQLEEAKKRDHRKLGKELELFTLIDEVGGGLPMFYPKGAVLRRLIENFIIELQENRGYVPIWIPHITKSELYKISGHLDKYDAMYPPMHLHEEADYYLKPMNCPHFMMLYKTQPHSYRELPMRWTCTTTNYRYEKSGELSGLTRVRALTQDDCHVFARPDQIAGEINLMLDMVAEVYGVFGFSDFWVRISTHDPAKKEGYIGDAGIWERSEQALKDLISERGWKHEIGVGEAAFYGPKLDFMFRDVIGRQWQLTTIQLDMNLPERFELEYADADGEKKRPVVIHRAILGSVERFLGILIEHYAGAFPAWLAPVQVKLLPVADKHIEAATEAARLLRAVGVRVEIDGEAGTIGAKVRKSETEKVPFSVVYGDKEVSGEPWQVRVRGSKEAKVMSASEFGEYIAKISREHSA